MRGITRPVVAVALADLKERSRSTKLLVVPVLVAAFVKAVAVDTTLVVADGYTGEPTIAWFAGMTTVIGTTAFFLFGFSLVKGSITRDRTTGVGELIAPSVLSSGQYVLGKWLSYVVVLGLATGILLASTGVAFLLRGTGGVALWTFVSPFLLITLPTMAVVAAAAVCVETVGPLRGTAGTVVYFAVAATLLTVGLAPDTPLDFTGLALVRESMVRSIATQYPAFEHTTLGFAYTDAPGSVRPFSWAGITWTGARLATRVPIVGIAVGLLAVATVAFDRFDESNRWSLLGRRDQASGGAPDTESSTDRVQTSTSHPPSVAVDLTPVTREGWTVARVVLAELRIALRGHPRWWYVAGCLGVAAAGLAPIGTVRTLVVPTALLLPLSAWAALGARERLHRTEELVFVGSRPGQLLGATYVSGVLVGLLMTFPAPIRFAMAGLDGALFGWGVGVLCLPAVALAMGVWTGRPKTFEIALLTAWYLGPMNGVPVFDYLGVREATVASGVPLVYLGLALLALGVAFVGRMRGEA